MTKRELVKRCVEIQSVARTLPNFADRTAAYEECKKMCVNSGHTVRTFDEIWIAACREIELSNGSYNPLAR